MRPSSSPAAEAPAPPTQQIPPSPIEISRRKHAANLRRLAAKVAWGSDRNSPYGGTLFLLQHLEPCGVATAIKAQAYLIRDAVRDLTEVGCVELCLPDLLAELDEFIRSHYLIGDARGRWIPDPRMPEWRWEEDHWHLYEEGVRWEKSPQGGWQRPRAGAA